MKIEIGQYRKSEKGGALRAYFSFVIYPEGQQINDCKLFEKDGATWFSFPQREVKKDGEKTSYFPVIKFLNKTYEEQLKTAVLSALKEHNGKESTQSKNTQEQSNNVQAEPFPLW